MTTELFKQMADEIQPTDDPTIFANGKWLALVSYDLESGICKSASLQFGVWPIELGEVFNVKIADVDMLLRF